MIESARNDGQAEGLRQVCWEEPLSVARIVKLNEPSAVGVPLSVPLDERFTPPGKEPAANAQVYGAVPPVAAKVWE